MLATYEQKRIVYDSQRGWSNNNINGCKIGYIHAISRFLDYVERRLISSNVNELKADNIGEKKKMCTTETQQRRSTTTKISKEKKQCAHFYREQENGNEHTYYYFLFAEKDGNRNTKCARTHWEMYAFSLFRRKRCIKGEITQK